MSNIYDFVKELNVKAAEELIKAYNDNNNNNNNNACIPLIFPKYQNDDQKPQRVSEQELRFAMANMFNKELESSNLKCHFSVETPTKKTYRFSGKKETTAQTDMTVYDDIQINIEFKANNPEYKSFCKDIEKLLREDVKYGMWCHILKNADNGTWNSLFDKFKESFKSVIDNPKYNVEKKTIYFSFLVLDKKEFYRKELKDISKYNDFFNDKIDTWEKIDF